MGVAGLADDRPGLVVLTIELEAALPLTPHATAPAKLTSPYRAPLTKYLCVYADKAIAYFLKPDPDDGARGGCPRPHPLHSRRSAWAPRRIWRLSTPALLVIALTRRGTLDTSACVCKHHCNHSHSEPCFYLNILVLKLSRSLI